MIYRIGLLYVIEWLIIANQATAYMSGCVDGLCFISSPPGTNVLSWTLADQWCRDNRTQLMEITNRGVQNAVSSFLNNIRSTYNYNGRSLFTNGKRNAGSWTWVTGNIANYRYDQPSDLAYAYKYLQLTTSGITISDSRAAETKQGYICENESQCTNTNGVMLNSRCYRSYNNEALSWYDARMRCLDRGGDLASFDFIDNQGISILNGTWLRQQTTYLIGLRREWWTWQRSRGDVKYSSWLSVHPITYPNDPNDCLCLEPSQWKWVECRCRDERPFICMSGELRSSSTTTTTTTTTTTSTSKTAPKLDTLITTSTSVSNDNINGAVNTINSRQSSENAMPTTFYNTKIAIGVGVGVGGGILVVAIAVVVAVIIIRKRPHRSGPEKKDKTKKPTKLQPPDIIALQTTSKEEESPYGTVVRPPDFDDSIAYYNVYTDKPQTVYADLEILTKSSSADNSPSVANDTGSSRPSSPSRLTEADFEVGHVQENCENTPQ